MDDLQKEKEDKKRSLIRKVSIFYNSLPKLLFLFQLLSLVPL